MKMWTKFRASIIKKDGKESREGCKSLNVNEEYFSALRTKSYADFFTKAQSVLVNEHYSSPCHHKFSKILLEPDQETIPFIIDSAVLSKIPELKSLMHIFFDISAEASKICSHLLKNINQMQSNYHFIQSSLETLDNFSPEKIHYIMLQLNSFANSKNPFSNPNDNEFKIIHEKYLSVLQHLKSKRKSVARKMKFIKYFKKASGVCITAACGLIAITAIVLALHTFTAMLLGPAIFSIPIKRWKKLEFPRCGVLGKVWEQLDVAAKGMYILNRDFDTMSRLVARLYDEIEHHKAMVQFIVERNEDRFCMQFMKELRKSNVGVRKQAEELEEHVYLCLVTINRARGLVIKEITTCMNDSRQV